MEVSRYESKFYVIEKRYYKMSLNQRQAKIAKFNRFKEVDIPKIYEV